MSECPVCYEYTVSVFTNTCQHSWCKSCHQLLIHHKHINCPICRDPIQLKRRPTPKNEYIKGGSLRERVVPEKPERKKDVTEMVLQSFNVRTGEGRASIFRQTLCC